LPVRRNVELCDELIDGENSLIQQQAGNRVHAAQTVLKQILENNSLQKIHDDEKTAIVHY
jgi:N-succinyl-L-ornithine transcarbamylase